MWHRNNKLVMWQTTADILRNHDYIITDYFIDL